jgi:hypothetical protein
MANIICCEKRCDENMTMETIKELEHLKPVEWLTTGQMIDQLKVGGISEVVIRAKTKYVTRTIDGYYWCNRLGHPFILDRLVINEVVSQMKWRILPKLVCFVEAYEAYKKGKEIVVEYVDVMDQTMIHRETYEMGKFHSFKEISWYVICEGKWSIKN